MKKSFEETRKAAGQGDVESQCSLGIMYAEGEGVAKNAGEAVRWFRAAERQGYAKAQSNLGMMYYKGEGVAKDKTKALRLFRAAAEQGVAKAQNGLGVMYHKGEGVTKDKSKAMRWFRAAAEQGFAKAQYNLGGMYDRGEGVAEDKSKAVRLFRAAAEQGFADAQNKLGWMYSKGEGVAKDAREAVRWYRVAVEQGLASAQLNLGFMYVEGEGVAKDFSEAVRLYRLAVEQGDVRAQSNLGVMYYKGEGVAEDKSKAVRLFRAAAERGDAEAQHNLGVMYEKGEGADDKSEAVRWYRAAAEQGDAEAQKKMRGHIYIVANKGYPGLLKIGKTTRSVRKRIRELNSTNTPYDFYLVKSYLVGNTNIAERVIHEKLRRYRHRGDREFFKAPERQVIELCDHLLGIEIEDRKQSATKLVKSLDDISKALYRIIFYSRLDLWHIANKYSTEYMAFVYSQNFDRNCEFSGESRDRFLILEHPAILKDIKKFHDDICFGLLSPRDMFVRRPMDLYFGENLSENLFNFLATLHCNERQRDEIIKLAVAPNTIIKVTINTLKDKDAADKIIDNAIENIKKKNARFPQKTGEVKRASFLGSLLFGQEDIEVERLVYPCKYFHQIFDCQDIPDSNDCRCEMCKKCPDSSWPLNMLKRINDKGLYAISSKSGYSYFLHSFKNNAAL